MHAVKRIPMLGASVAIIALAIGIFLMTRSTPAQAFQTGQVLHNGNPDNGAFLCSECHSGEPSPAAIEITGPTELAPGESGTFTATVTGGPGAVGGFNLSSTGHLGDLGTLGADTRLFFNEITHTEPKAFANGAASFEFTWTAPPEPQPIVLYAAGVSGNGDERNSGDSVAATTFAVEVREPDSGGPSGDVNGDGEVDAADVQAVLDASVGLSPEVADLTAGDMNSDGQISLIDALLLVQLIP